jgi:predicted nucleotidyltransferase
MRSSRALTDVHPEVLLEAAAPILAHMAEGRGFTRLAVFGSVARHSARQDSDIDLLVSAPPDTSIGDLLAVRDLFERVLGRPVDLTTYGGLKPGLDDDIHREAVLL